MNEDLKALIATAEAGDAEAQYRYAMHLYHHDFNYKEAEYYLIKAAEQGHAESQYRLGSEYETGANFEKNHVLYIEWHIKAAEQGHSEAEFSLANACLLGDFSPRYIEIMCKYLVKVAKDGHAPAQYLADVIHRYILNDKLGYENYDLVSGWPNVQAAGAVKRFKHALTKGKLKAIEIVAYGGE